jgi:hypothetical protein
MQQGKLHIIKDTFPKLHPDIEMVEEAAGLCREKPMKLQKETGP